MSGFRRFSSFTSLKNGDFRTKEAEASESKRGCLPSPDIVDFQTSEKIPAILPSLTFAQNGLVFSEMIVFAEAKRQK